MGEPTPRVFVVDDDAAVRESLMWLLGSEGLDVVTYPSAEAFLGDQRDVSEGCALIDVRMPGMSGLDLQKEMHARKIDLPVIIITGHGDVTLAVDAMKRGAWDFAEKPFRDTEIIQKVWQALARDHKARQRQREIAAFESRLLTLTGREHEVLQLVVAGKVSREIALLLNISERTVAAHRARMMAKTEVRSVAHLVRMVTLMNEDKGALE